MIRLLPLLFAGGCATTAALGTARTLDAGETRFHTGAELGFVDARPFAAPLLRVDAGVSHGLSDRVEIGGSVGGWPVLVKNVHGGGHVKWALHRAPDPSRGVDVALGGAASVDLAWGGGVSGVATTAQVPLLVGINATSGQQLILGPRVAYQSIVSKGAHPIHKLYGGLTVGMALHGRGGTLLPQVGWLWASNPADQSGGMHTVQLGLGLWFE